MMGVAEVMVLEYNGKKKSSINKLPMRSLYEKPKQSREPDTMELFGDDTPVYVPESSVETFFLAYEDEDETI